MRPHFPQQPGGPLAVEDNHVIHAAEGGEHFGAVVLRVEGTVRTLQLTDGLVAVQTDSQSIAQGAGLAQIAHVTGMEQVEASVGEDEPLSGRIHLIAQTRQFPALHDASLVHGASNRIPPAIAQGWPRAYNVSMRIARIADESGEIHHACPTGESDLYTLLEGCWGKGFRTTDHTVRAVRLLAPLDPPAVYAIGLNYRDHATETGAPIPEYPVVFMKNLRAVIGPDAPIRLPRRLRSDQVDYEAELAVVLSRDCRNATRANAMEHVAGFTCANDVSARDWQLQRSGRQWCRAKSFDTFCPLGPWVVTPDELPHPLHLRIASRLNGEIMQESNTSQMIFDVPALLEFLSADTTLPGGAVILTGTPHGVGMARQPPVWLRPGDTVAIEIGGLGTLQNPVVEGD